LLLEINTHSQKPIYEQLRDQIVLGIATKQLVHGEAMPSVRNLAADLGINFHTVNKAYSMLRYEGYLIMDRRKGAVVAPMLTNNEVFFAKLSLSLSLSAAEAVCHSVGESEFLELCAGCYRNATAG